MFEFIFILKFHYLDFVEAHHFKKSFNVVNENSSNFDCKNTNNPRDYSLRSNFSNIFNDQV